MAEWSVLVVYALAVARVSGLIVSDDITDPIRHRIQKRSVRQNAGALAHFLADVVDCQWCASIWVAAVAAPLAWWFGMTPWLGVPALALAFSQVTGMLSQLGRR